MANFYGWKDKYIEDLPVDVFMGYLMAIQVIKSEQAMADIRSYSYPHIKEAKQRKMVIDIKASGSKFIEKKASITTRDMAARLAESMRQHG